MLPGCHCYPDPLVIPDGVSESILNLAPVHFPLFSRFLVSQFQPFQAHVGLHLPFFSISSFPGVLDWMTVTRNKEGTEHAP